MFAFIFLWRLKVNKSLIKYLKQVRYNISAQTKQIEGHNKLLLIINKVLYKIIKNNFIDNNC